MPDHTDDVDARIAENNRRLDALFRLDRRPASPPAARDHARVVEQLAPLDRSLYDSFRAAGMSEAQALAATRGRRPAGAFFTDGFDAVEATFLDAGMSERAARAAAVGRDGTEAQARRRLSEARPTASTAGPGHRQPSSVSRDGGRRDGLTDQQWQLFGLDYDRFIREGLSESDAEQRAWDTHNRREARLRARARSSTSTAGGRDSGALTEADRELLQADIDGYRRFHSDAEAERLAWEGHDRRQAGSRARRSTSTTEAARRGTVPLVERQPTDDDLDARIAESNRRLDAAFGRVGMSESRARIAARGRGRGDG